MGWCVPPDGGLRLRREPALRVDCRTICTVCGPCPQRVASPNNPAPKSFGVGFFVIIRFVLFVGNTPMIFHIILEEAEDGWIVAECPALPGCVSQGQDEKEAVDNIKEAIEAWLWAEDQKALSQWHLTSAKTPILVAV